MYVSTLRAAFDPKRFSVRNIVSHFSLRPWHPILSRQLSQVNINRPLNVGIESGSSAARYSRDGW